MKLYISILAPARPNAFENDLIMTKLLNFLTNDNAENLLKGKYTSSITNNIFLLIKNFASFFINFKSIFPSTGIFGKVKNTIEVFFVTILNISLIFKLNLLS